MKLLFLFLTCLILWLVIWPTVETQYHYKDIILEEDTHVLTLKTKPNYESNNSRIIHKVTSGSPYWLGLSFSDITKSYNRLDIDSVKLVNLENNRETEVSIFQNYDVVLNIKDISKGYSIPVVTKPSDFSGYLDLEKKSYRITLDYSLCIGEVCEKFTSSNEFSLTRKVKFYSETFAQMMGI